MRLPLLAAAVAAAQALPTIPIPGPQHFAALPDDFMWGSATASYQVEGAVKVDGRGDSIWDQFSHIKGHVKNGDTGDTADDQYHRYEEDIKLIANMGMGYYRFSIAWSRIFPTGEGPVNEAGIAHYNAVIDAALANGVRPLVTLFHWDLPLGLEEKYGGWLSPEIVALFKEYARTCFEAFGDRVQWWLTFNEPLTSARLGYSLGIHAPGRCSDRLRCPVGDSNTEPYIAAHNIILSHAAAMDVYRTDFEATQGGQVGITLNGDWGEPLRLDPLDFEASQRFHEFQMGWWADPAFFGDYPDSMKRYLADRLPTFTEEESALLKANRPKFFGFNHYTSQYISHFSDEELQSRVGDGWDYDITAKLSFYKDGEVIGIPGDPAWLYDVPWGFRKLLGWVYNRYQTPIVVTENGFSCAGENVMPLPGVLLDMPRVHYYSGYVAAMNDAVRAKEADVIGHFAWSALDNYEWHDGYSVRFGLHYVDYNNNLTRHVKASAEWFTLLTAMYANREPVFGDGPLGGATAAAAAVASAALAEKEAQEQRTEVMGAVTAVTALAAVAAAAAAWRRRRRAASSGGGGGAAARYDVVPEKESNPFAAP